MEVSPPYEQLLERAELNISSPKEAFEDEIQEYAAFCYY
jgi:hypothetical protein